MGTNILLAAVGLSPQVVTETLFALHQQGRWIDAIHIITTRLGKEQIHAHLLAPQDGQYTSYLYEYGIDSDSIDFNYSNIHTIKDQNGIEIDDIYTEEHNEALLSLCLVLTYRFTAQEDSAVFFSVAGGRKTMSSCLTLAAQMYGRRQDRIYHVLITPEYESNRDFYYPPKESKPIPLKDKQGNPYLKETQYASVNLISLPFVSIRERLSSDMLKAPADPATLMMSLVREDPYYLEIDLTQGRLRYKGLEMDMMPARLALYAFFALKKKECDLDRETCFGCHECFLSTTEILECHEEITGIYKKIAGKKDISEMSDTGIRDLSAENFQVYKSKIKQDLLKGFGPYSLPELAVESIGKKPGVRYGLMVERKRLKIIL